MEDVGYKTKKLKGKFIGPAAREMEHWIGDRIKTRWIELDQLWDGEMSSTKSLDLSDKGWLKIVDDGGPVWGRTPKNGQSCSCSN